MLFRFRLFPLARTLVAGGAILLVFARFAGPAQADTPPAQVLAAARQGLPAFLRLIPASELTSYGLANAEEVAQATLGEPYSISVMTPQALHAFRPGSRLASLLTTTPRWVFPVTVRGSFRTLLTVDYVDGQWQAVDLGGVELPRALDQSRPILPALAKSKGWTSYTTRLVTVPQARAEFLALETEQGDYLVPVMARPQSLGVNNLEAYRLDEMVGRLTPAIDQNILLDGETINHGLGGGAGANTHNNAWTQDYSLALLVLGGAFLLPLFALFFLRKNRKPTPLG